MSRPYHMSFACFECCKSFKRSYDLNNGLNDLACPHCGGAAHNLGRHFKAPRLNDVKQWQKVKFLFDHGFRFQKIATGVDPRGTVKYPETLEEAKKFVVKYREFALK